MKLLDTYYALAFFSTGRVDGRAPIDSGTLGGFDFNVEVEVEGRYQSHKYLYLIVAIVHGFKTHKK